MKNLIILIYVLVSTISFGQTIKNAKTIEVAIAGNCSMCKSTIENAANQTSIVHLEWDKETKLAQLTYDTNKTTPETVLKRVADMGYDNEVFAANDIAYSKLAPCCQYPRTEPTQVKKASCCSEAKKSCSADSTNQKAKSALK